MNGVSPVFRWLVVDNEGHLQGKTTPPTADSGKVTTYPFTYMRLGMISYTSALPTSSI